MYIDENGFNSANSSPSDTEGVQMTEASADNSPGYAPISPNTPSWGPPSSITGSGSSSGSNSDPGYAPISPNTPSWGPPSSITGSGSNSGSGSGSAPSWRPPSGGSSGNFSPIIVVPGQSGCFNCNTGSSSSQYSNVRFFHAAVNQPAVSIKLGNRTVINNLQFGNSTPYYLDNSGNTLVTVTSTQTGRTLFRRYINFSSQNAYTVSLVNDSSGITLFTLTDTPCSHRNSACLRAVNLSPNSGAVDIFLSGYGRLFQGVGQLDATGYNAVRQGTYRASVSESLPCSNNNSVIVADTYVQCNNTQIAIMNSSTINVMNGVTYTLYIIGLAYQFPSLQILALESDLIY